jgi:hypothetical protein
MMKKDTEHKASAHPLFNLLCHGGHQLAGLAYTVVSSSLPINRLLLQSGSMLFDPVCHATCTRVPLPVCGGT